MAELATATVASTMLDFIEATPAAELMDSDDMWSTDEELTTNVDRPTIEDETAQAEEAKEEDAAWQAWFSDQFGAFKTWIDALLQQAGGNGTAADDKGVVATTLSGSP